MVCHASCSGLPTSVSSEEAGMAVGILHPAIGAELPLMFLYCVAFQAGAISMLKEHCHI